MGNNMGGTSPRCSTTIVITPPAYSEFYEQFSLTEREKSIIQKSWTLSERSTLLNVGQRIIDKVFAVSPESKKLFQTAESDAHQFNPSFYKHVRAIMNLMEFAVSKIDDEDGGEKLWRTCFEVGKRHARFREHGFNEEYWTTFKAAVLQCVVDWEGIQCSRRSVEAWSKFITYICDHMKSGYQYEITNARSLSVPNNM